MQENGADLLFSPVLIGGLRNIRGESWQELVERVAILDHLASDLVPFVYMMVQLSGCVTCQADSYKSMRGCAVCSVQTIKRFRGSDHDLLEKFDESRLEIRKYLQEERYVNE